eukprot:22332_1
MRFNLAVSRLGSVANYKISPVLYNRSGTVAAALWFSAGLLAVCLVGIVIMFVVDRWHSNLISNMREAFAMRFNLAVSRLGSVANYKISPVLYNRSGTVAAALWFSAGLLAVCLVGIVIMFVVDRWHSNLISNMREQDPIFSAPHGSSTTSWGSLLPQ